MTEPLLQPASLPQESILASRILIVDDSEFNRFLLRQIFDRHGFCNIVCANDGVEALKVTSAFKPHLILLDLMMPHMDGYEFCRRLRAIPEFKDVPVLAQTAVESQEDHNRMFRMGATDLVTKPVNADELMARARVHLERLHLIVSLQQYRARIASELTLARDMQNELMPSAALIQKCQRTYHIDISHHLETPSEMGGDMWGCKPLNEYELAVFMSDFSGHGVTAALNAFRLHTLMQELSPHFDQNAGSYLDALSKHSRPLLGKAQFATMFYGVIDTHKSLLHYATAATPTPLIFRGATGTIEKLDGSGYPLAMAELQSHYPTLSTPLHAGDMLILYSDALIETPWKDGKFLSEDAIIAYLEDAGRNGLKFSADAIKDALLNYFRAFAELPIKDDLTISIYHRL